MYLDAHTHLDHYTAGDLPTALEQIAQQRIYSVSVAMDPPSYARCKAIAARLPDLVLPTFGVHPWEAVHWADRLDELDPLIAESPMLGEIGLDTHWITDAATYPAQQRVLEHFLAAARDQHKIVNLHTKGAEMPIRELLAQYDVERAIVHWYSGGRPALRELIAHGCYFTIGVEIHHSPKIRTIAGLIPADRLLTETDNPGGWSWLNRSDPSDINAMDGPPGMPALVPDVVTALAAMRDMPPDVLRRTVNANWRRLLAGDLHLRDVHARLCDDPDTVI